MQQSRRRGDPPPPGFGREYLKKVGITTSPFRHGLNQIPYDYTVKVSNRCKGLDLIDREPDELWMEVHDIVQETGIKTSPWKRNEQRGGGLQSIGSQRVGHDRSNLAHIFNETQFSIYFLSHVLSPKCCFGAKRIEINKKT